MTRESLSGILVDVKGVWFEDKRARVREDLPRPEPGAGGCRVRVTRAGVCATDLALLRGYMGFVGTPGHEFVGVALDGPLAGERVVGEINAACGACAACRRGEPRHCPTRSVLGIVERGGAFAEELALPSGNLYRVPDTVDDDAATFAEPLAAAFEILEQVPVCRGQRALVAGDGRLGLLCAIVLRDAGLDVDIAGHHEARGELVPGARHLGDALGQPAAERYDLVVEATGNSHAVAQAVEQVRPRGTLVLKTTTEEDPVVPVSKIVVDEITVVGSRCGPFDRALDGLARGLVPVAELVHARFPLDEGPAALERAGARGTLKVLLEIG
jgi:threonine dehydrogenase-like Zn-dependent dehydrogenase